MRTLTPCDAHRSKADESQQLAGRSLTAGRQKLACGMHARSKSETLPNQPVYANLAHEVNTVLKISIEGLGS